jgi:hypothetical protein
MSKQRSEASRKFYRWRAKPAHLPALDHECGCPQSQTSGQSYVADSTGDGGTYIECRYCGRRQPLGRGMWADTALGDRAFWPGEQQSHWSTFK